MADRNLWRRRRQPGHCRALLDIVLRTLSLGTAYAVWTGIGTVGTPVLGVVLFGDSATAVRLVCIGPIVAGILGLKLASAA